MRKWAVLALVLFLAAAALFQYARRRDALRKAAAPELKRQNLLPAALLAVPPVSGPPATYGALPTVKDIVYDRGSCSGGSVNDILSSHGRIWGYAASTRAFSPQETEAVYRLLTSYFSCVGLAKKTPAYCDYLPAESGDKDFAVPLPKSPNYKCRAAYLDVAFPGFTAGRGAGPDCLAFYGDNFGGSRSNIRSGDFCRAAAKGLENLCGELSGFISKADTQNCRRVFPARQRDCGDSPGCFYRVGIYEALKSGSAEACPEDYRAGCGAYLASSTETCQGALDALGAAYCGYLAGAQKAYDNMAGYTPEEAQEALAAKAEMERRAVQQKKQDEEINRRVRKMLGKE